MLKRPFERVDAAWDLLPARFVAVTQGRWPEKSAIIDANFILYRISNSIQSLSTGDKPGVARNFTARLLNGGTSCQASCDLFPWARHPAASFSMASAQQFRITHAGLRTLYPAPVFIGIDRGLFKARDLEVAYKEIDSGALSSAALLLRIRADHGRRPDGHCPSRQAGQAFHDGLQFTRSHDHGHDCSQRRTPSVRGTIRTRRRKQRGKILKGMTIGITRPAAPTDIFSRFIMLEAGLDAQKDATLVQVGGPAALRAAFQSGKIDAFMLSPPLPQTLEKQGLGTTIVSQYRRRPA